MSDVLRELVQDLCRDGQPELALCLPDAVWLARLLRGPEPAPAELDSGQPPEPAAEAATRELTAAPRIAGLQSPEPATPPVGPATPPPLRIERFEVPVPDLLPDQLSVGMLVPKEHRGGQSASRGEKVKILSPPGLDDPNEYGRRLKPLRQFRRNPRKPVLDVTRTVERICDEQIWELVVRHPYDRCLHLTWIIDGGGSMDLWLQIGRELFVACRDSGAFRSCLAYQWDVDAQWQQTFTPLDSNASPGAGHPHVAWPAAGHDRLIAIFSDCSAGRWYRPETRQKLSQLTDQAHLLIVNPLPERMWGRTVLGQATEVDLRSPVPAAPGRRLQVCRTDPWEPRHDLDRQLKLVAVTGEPDQLLGWSRFVAGQRAVYPGFCLDVTSRPIAKLATLSKLDAAQRLARFRRYASRGGRELARLLSAVPLITPRFIRMVRRDMMSREFCPELVHEAEVLLSPLLRELDREGDDERIYDFYPGVRELLLEQTRTEDVQRVFLHFVTLEVRGDLHRTASLGEYGAMIPRPGDANADCSVFLLSVAPTELIMRRLGGEFRRLLENSRENSLRFRLNSHLLRARESQAAGKIDAALRAIEDARKLVRDESRRWGSARTLLDEQLRSYRAMLLLPEAAEKARAEREPFIEPVTKMILAPIPAGSFLMGSPDEERGRYEDEKRHRVTLSHDFWMGVYPVTQQQYKAVMDKTPSRFQGPNRPVEQVSWEDARAFCSRLTESAQSAGILPDGYEFRLPTEAEWEYCCRAGIEKATAFGDSLSSEQANFNGDYPYGDADKGPYLERTSDVGSYPPNAWGLYDMHGNVWEWCLDSAELTDGKVVTDTYVADAVDPVCRKGGDRVYRGGGWGNVGGRCRSACRDAREPGYRYDYLGFRVCLARSPERSEP